MFLTLLRTRRWIGFTALVAGAIVLFGLLSLWQWHRAEERRGERVVLQTALSADPTSLGSLLPVDAADAWTPVVVTGSYRADAQVLVRKRPLEGRNGFWAMTPLDTAGGVVWVNRGWLPAGADALAAVVAPLPPAGTVTVRGFARPFEPATDNTGLPAGQIAAPAPGGLPDAAAGGYVQLAESSPVQDGLVPVPVPTLDESRNISYAVQWLLFALVALGGWSYFLRREAREESAARDVTRREGSVWTST